MFELVQFTIKTISKTCSVVFNVPKLHKKTFDMFELVHFSIKVISNTCTVLFDVPRVHSFFLFIPISSLSHQSHLQYLHRTIQLSKSSRKPVDLLENHLHRLCTDVQYPQFVHNMDRLSSMGTESHNCGVQTFDKCG